MVNLQVEAREFLAGFMAEFGKALDLDDDSDSEYAAAALAEMRELRGVTWEAWRAALEAK